MCRSPLDGADPVGSFDTVEGELRAHGRGLERLPRILALSKADLVAPDALARRAGEIRERLAGRIVDSVVTSAATGAGIERLRQLLLEHVAAEAPAVEPPAAAVTLAEHRVYRPGEDERFGVERVAPGAYRVCGRQGRAAARAPRPRQRRGAPLHRGPAAGDRCHKRAPGGGIRAWGRRRDRRRRIRARSRLGWSLSGRRPRSLLRAPPPERGRAGLTFRPWARP